MSSNEAGLQTSAGAAQYIALDLLRESQWNPRKHFPAEAMAKLVASMEQEGFWPWNALVARPRLDGGYEIGAGHRRFRAAKEAGLQEVPVYVREMSDEDFLRVLMFDNSNREDVHPLDEAAGFRFYLDRSGKKVADIAAQIGQSREYVYQRLKYADLIEPAQKAFWAGEISSGHAVLIARLPPAEQERALKVSDNMSVRDLGDWIAREVHRDVKKAHFDSDDAQLVRGIPACTTCPSRAGNAPELFPGIAADTCTNPSCFERKQQTHVNIQIAKRAGEIRDGAKKLPLLTVIDSYNIWPGPQGALTPGDYVVIGGKVKTCDHARDAIVVAGDVGKMLSVCVEKKCTVHRTASGVAAAVGTATRPASAAEREEERQRKEKVDRDDRLKRLIPGAVAAKCAIPYGKTELLVVAQFLLGDFVDPEPIAAELGVKPGKKPGRFGGGPEDDYVGPLLRYLAGLSEAALGRKVMGFLVGALFVEEQQALARMSFGIDLEKLAEPVVEKVAPAPKKPQPKAAKKKAAAKPVKPPVKKAKAKK